MVLSTLGLSAVPPGDPDMRRRVSTFITCNGYEGVLRAAQYAAARAVKEHIEDPWAYTVRAYNNNLARLSFLYVLVHWTESGLRSQVDIRFTRPFGAQWYRFPERYLPVGLVQYFWGDAAHKELRWESAPTAVGGKRVADCGSGAEFLEQISLGWLAHIIVHGYDGHLGRFLVSPSGGQIIRSEAQSLLEAAKKARNAVAHNRYLTNDEYREASAKLLHLLKVLEFDVAKALQRIETARAAVVTRVLRELGGGRAPG